MPRGMPGDGASYQSECPPLGPRPSFPVGSRGNRAGATSHKQTCERTCLAWLVLHASAMLHEHIFW